MNTTGPATFLTDTMPDDGILAVGESGDFAYIRGGKMLTGKFVRDVHGATLGFRDAAGKFHEFKTACKARKK